ncbi:MAG TPA: hypothetical protein VGK16_15075 [Candidatus Limnocylindrales bacterium]
MAAICEATSMTKTILHLTPDERAVVTAALRLLRSILGKDEADELEVVKALLERLRVSADPT